MKQFVVCSLALLSLTSVNAQTKKAPAKTPVKTAVTKSAGMKSLLDSFSYAVGLNIASNMKQQGISALNTSMVQKALDDAYLNKPKLLTDEKAAQCLQEQLSIFQQHKAADDMKKSAGEKAKGQTFLAENKKRPGVITLPNGMQYEVLTPGDPNGAKPAAADNVVVHYAGTFIDGKPFDSSIERGEPATFGVGAVIRGWTEILQMMTKGAKWKVYIPSDLAYGDAGRPGIPAGATLIFEISLIDINPVTK